MTSIYQSYADTMVMNVTKEQAQAWGVRVQAHTNGDAGIKVTLNLKTQGKWEEFRMVEFRMQASGQHLLSAPLQIRRPAKDSISTSFSVQKASLQDCAFWVYVDDIPLGGSAYRLQVKDFVDLETLSLKPAVKRGSAPPQQQVDPSTATGASPAAAASK